MELPTKHHFNPAFSLKPWAGKDENVCQMRKIGGKVVPRRVHPNATGFAKNVYQISGLAPEKAQYVETNFFNRGNPAHRHPHRQRPCEGGSRPW